MWQSHSEKRLAAWVDLRNSCKDNPNIEEVITNIHDWWQHAPMVLRYLHCDLINDWPDPWDLIAENTYCDLAKCLGMCYTICMLERQDINLVCITEIDNNDYIVQVNNGIYTLNWNVDKIVNMKTLDNIKITRNIDSAMFAQKIR
jgi:hypothetical protein